MKTLRATAWLTLTAIAATTSAAAPSLAQEPTSSPTLQPLAPVPPLPQLTLTNPARPLFGEPTGDASSLSGFAASAPLRLSLQSGIFPMAGAFPQCSTGDPAGSVNGGIPVQKYTLLRLTPNLVLHGFSSVGCPIDGAIGVGVTYAVPIRPTLWLVASAGAYGAPAQAAMGTRLQSDVRLDLVKTIGNSRALTFGIGRKGVAFGGVF